MGTVAENEIRDYLNLNEVNGALLILGKWGSGKTHLINQIIEAKDLKDKYYFVKCSLFGISKSEDAEKLIKRHFLFSNEVVDKVDKKRDSIFNTVKAVNNRFKYGSIINSALSIDIFDFIDLEKEYGIGKLKKETVLILDDIEGSDIKSSELQGLINYYCENKEIKIILIGNEDEIDDTDKFSKFKEKVVFRTIYIDNDYKEIINSIIEEYVETISGYKTFLKDNAQYILKAFMESKAENIRLLKSCIIDFERVYSIFNKKGDFKLTKLGEVLYSFCAYKYEIDLGNYTKDENGNSAFTQIGKYSQLKRSIMLNSLLDWIKNSKWKEEAVEREINEKFSDKNLSSDEKILHYSFWTLDSKTIDEGWPMLIERGYKGELNRNELIRFLNIHAALEELQINLNIDVDYKKFIEAWDKREDKIRNGLLEEEEKHNSISELISLKYLNKDANKLNKRLEDFDRKSKYYDNRLKVIELIKDPTKEVLMDAESNIIPYFDDEMADLFVKSYLKADNAGKYDLMTLLIDMNLRNKVCSDKKDMQVSIKGLMNAYDKLKIERKNIEGTFDKCVISQTIETLEIKASNIKKELNKKS